MREGWITKTLGEIGKIASGKSIPSSDIVDTFSNGLFPCYGGNGLRGYVNKYTYDGRYPIIGRVGALCGNVHLAEGKFYPTEHALVMSLKNGDNPYFIKYLLLSLGLNSFAKGVAQPVLSAGTLSRISVPIPPLQEQEKIVAELDLLTEIIDKQKQQLKELDTLAQSIFYDMFGNPVQNDREWAQKTIGDLCTLKSGNSSANNSEEGDLPYVKVGDMNIPENNPFITTSSTFVNRDENKKNILPIGTIVFPKRGGAIYTNKKRITAVEICCDLNIMGVIPSKAILSSYLYHYFLSIDFGELCNGAAIPQLNNIDIAPLPIGIPPLELQESFAKKIQSIESQKQSINRSIAESQKLFDYTMDKYFG